MKIPILRVRDKDGNVVEIPAIVGPPGPKGEPGVGMGNIQASDVTCENGKTVEEQLAELWQGDASMAQAIDLALSQAAAAVEAEATELEAHTSNKANPHGVTAAQIGALPVHGCGYLPNGTDVRNLTSGWYVLQDGYTYYNLPAGYSSWGVLVIWEKIGVVWQMNTGKVWYASNITVDALTWGKIYTEANMPTPEELGAVKGNNGVVTGSLSISGNAGVLNLIGADHVYVPFFRQGVGSARSGYVGYGDGADANFTIHNEVAGGCIKMVASGGLTVNGVKVPTTIMSTGEPNDSVGTDGDVWHQYV